MEDVFFIRKSRTCVVGGSWSHLASDISKTRFCGSWYFQLCVFKKLKKSLSHLYECFAYMCVSVLRACLLPAKVRRGHQIIGTGVIDGGELLYGHWELNLGSLQAS